MVPLLRAEAGEKESHSQLLRVCVCLLVLTFCINSTRA
jgi:hypothetical protein